MRNTQGQRWFRRQRSALVHEVRARVAPVLGVALADRLVDPGVQPVLGLEQDVHVDILAADVVDVDGPAVDQVVARGGTVGPAAHQELVDDTDLGRLAGVEGGEREVQLLARRLVQGDPDAGLGGVVRARAQKGGRVRLCDRRGGHDTQSVSKVLPKELSATVRLYHI